MRITKIDESAYLPASAVRRLLELGEFTKHDDRPTREEAVARLLSADIAIVEWTKIDRNMLERVRDRLKYIVVALTGYEFVDVHAAREFGIPVSNIPGYSRQSVAEHAFAMLLALTRRVRDADQAARAGKRDYFEPFLSTELYEKTLGILGLGNIGSWIAQIGAGFGMKVIGHSRSPKHLPGVADVNLTTLLKDSDVLMVCVDYNKSTEGMLSVDRLSLMKPTAVLVSIAPSQICDEAAMAEMIKDHKLGGVALDIPAEHSPLEDQVESTILTPGIAWYTRSALDRLVSILISNVESFLAGSHQNAVN
jgi:glycerate dehydrogenase